MSSQSARRAIEEKLESYYAQISSIILSKQNPCTGLIPASVAITTHGDYRDAWVRDNVYSIIAVWGLALAYRRIDDDKGAGYELEHATIKCMRGLLFAMMGQASKVENFKNTQALEHSLHAKYNTATGAPVVGDFEWGHLQIDATSIFLLTLAQMTTSGLQIIYTMDEVSFVQNLVFYIERAYRTPDYGIWERGNKINHGMPELNSSSIGMALAALQAINGVNLFGARGGPTSVIHVLPDELTRNYTTLHSALPRESNSKEVDAALLSVISYPAFAVQDPALVVRTRNEIVKKLGGRFGCKRFLRDGHQTVLEDNSRLHYDPNELKVFEHIECEWPLFFTYLMLDGYFRNDIKQADEYRLKLDSLSVKSTNHLMPPTSHTPLPRINSRGSALNASASPLARRFSLSRFKNPSLQEFNLIPELYIVPKSHVAAEKENPGSQPRIPNENVPLVWAQSLYFLGNLINDNLLSPAELDPLGRRLLPYQQKNNEVVVQLVLLAENMELQAKLATFGLDTQCVESCEPVTISPPSVLRDAYTALGENTKLGLTGRPRRPIGTIGTSKLYRCQGRLYAFLPHFMDKEEFYLVSDNDYLVSVMEQEIAFVKNHWWYTGRPTMIVMLTNEMLGTLRATSKERRINSNRNLLNFVMSLKSGICAGTRVRVARLSELIGTACIESLDFLVGAGEDWHNLLKGDVHAQCYNTLPHAERNPTSSHIGPRRRIRNKSKDSRVSAGSKSPLTSSFYTDDSDGEPLDIGPSAVSDNAGRGLASNRSAKSTLTEGVSEKSELKRRRSYLFEVNPAASANPTAPDISNEAPLPKLAVETDPDILTLTLGDPTYVLEAEELLRSSANLYDQIDVLHYLESCKGLEHYIANLGTISNLLEEVYTKAMQLRQWSIVRQTAGLLKKVVNSLTINVADLMIRQKPVTVGFGEMEYFITSPLSPSALAEIIYQHCTSDVREAPVVQEVLTYLGSFIRSQPQMFEGIMRIRTHFFIIAMREEISRVKGCCEEDAVEYLMQLSPFEMKQLLGQVLTARDQTNFTSELRLNQSPFKPRVSLAAKKAANAHEESDLKAVSATSLPNTMKISCQSAGFLAGNFSKIEIFYDSQMLNNLPLVFGRGMNVVVIDPYEGKIFDTGSFDTHISADDADDFARVIDSLDPGMIVVIVCKDDAREHMTESAKIACEAIGSNRIREIEYRDSWCIIGEKGAEKGSVPESLQRAGEEPTKVITRTIDLAEIRKKYLANLPKSGENTDGIASSPNVYSALLMPSNGRWLRRRKNDGALNRVPSDFYPRVWRVLSKCVGIMIREETLHRDPTVSEKTPEEFNFALQVESLLDVIRDPAERQIAVECLVVISRIEDRNPEITVSGGVLDIMKIIRDAVARFWDKWCADGPNSIDSPVLPMTTPTVATSPDLIKATASNVGNEFEKNERLARRLFYDLPQDGPDGTMSFLATSCVRLVFDVSWSTGGI